MTYLDTISNIDVLKMPVGRAFLLTAAFGLANGLSGTLDRLLGGRLPAIAVQAGVAAAIENIGPIKRFLGPDAADLISVAALTAGINGQFNISGMVVNAIDKITSFLPGMSPAVASIAATSTTAATTTAPLAGYPMGGYAMGAPKTQLPNVDDVDLALLSARGYQTA